jgi:hypothetical protein
MLTYAGGVVVACVGCYDGMLHFANVADGRLVWSFKVTYAGVC